MTTTPHRILIQVVHSASEWVTLLHLAPYDAPLEIRVPGVRRNRQTQEEAERIARALFHSFARAELEIHDRHGQIREKDTWPRSSDPADIPG